MAKLKQLGYKYATLCSCCPDTDYILTEKIKEWFNGNVTILELGFGEAIFAGYILSDPSLKNLVYWGIEKDKRLFKEAKSLEEKYKGKCNLIEGDVRKIDKIPKLKNLKVDVILISEVFSCLKNNEIKELLEKLLEFMKRGSKLVIIDTDSNVQKYDRSTEDEVLRSVDANKLKGSVAGNYGIQEFSCWVDILKTEYRSRWSGVLDAAGLGFWIMDPKIKYELVKTKNLRTVMGRILSKKYHGKDFKMYEDSYEHFKIRGSFYLEAKPKIRLLTRLKKWVSNR